jgi:adenylylsulfate kinase-like enzyme
MIIRKKCGIVFWIIGLSGSGKSSIGNKIFKNINKNYGKTIIIHGDDIRNIYNLKNYDLKSRLSLGKSNSDLCNLISKQGINVIFTTVGLFHKLYKYNKSNLKRYIEIYIKSEMKDLLKNKKKIFYRNRSELVWGLDLKTEFPKKPDITLENNFKFSIQKLSEILLQKIDKKLKDINNHLANK